MLLCRRSLLLHRAGRCWKRLSACLYLPCALIVSHIFPYRKQFFRRDSTFRVVSFSMVLPPGNIAPQEILLVSQSNPAVVLNLINKLPHKRPTRYC